LSGHCFLAFGRNPVDHLVIKHIMVGSDNTNISHSNECINLHGTIGISDNAVKRSERKRKSTNNPNFAYGFELEVST